ncbi:hypothetical protein LAZ67_2000497 [Cordylochernes scorpioides]|uniref:Thyroid peroxidase n=1 Tax=Cordylochernes scorpioides TaxID=51811 RepID=A0ABY6K1C4_9ARAC|nr:hypothetical protein LAZ67_2000497 [Cordylochernes scorpioides]
MAASDMRNRFHVQPLLTWSTNAAHPVYLDSNCWDAGHLGHRIKCCDIQAPMVHPECLPVAFPDAGCMEYVRSTPAARTGCTLGPRDQVNQVETSTDFKSLVLKKGVMGPGDVRVNTRPGLREVHAVWARHHNRLALDLARLNPHWDDHTLFEETRKILGAQVDIPTHFLDIIKLFRS